MTYRITWDGCWMHPIQDTKSLEKTVMTYRFNWDGCWMHPIQDTKASYYIYNYSLKSFFFHQ
jgi:hypothetical protein